MPDVGATLAALETACNRKAYRVGKPNGYALSQMLKDHFADETDVDLSKFCYVGDNIETDV